jgi:hypothetical protein
MKIFSNPHTMLTRLVGLNLIFDVIAVAIWFFVPSTQTSLMLGVSVAYIDAAVAAALFAVAFLGIMKKQKWGAILAIAVTVTQRIINFFQFERVAVVFTLIWSILIVYFAYKELKGSSPAKTPS